MAAFKIDVGVRADEDFGISRSDLTIEKLPGLPIRAQIESYLVHQDTPARVEWGPLAGLAKRLRQRHNLSADDLVRSLTAQHAPIEVVQEAAKALTEES